MIHTIQPLSVDSMIDELSDKDLCRIYIYWKLKWEEQIPGHRTNPNHYENQKLWMLQRELKNRGIDEKNIDENELLDKNEL